MSYQNWNLKFEKNKKEGENDFFILFHQAQDCDILVHEATHEDEFAEDSDRKGHR